MRFQLVPVFRIGRQHARQKRTQRGRNPGLFHRPRRAHHHQQCGRGEYLSRIRLGHEAEDRPQQIAAADHHGQDHRHHAQHAEQVKVLGRRRSQQRHRGNQWNRCKVLEQQDREYLPPIGLACLLALGQYLQAERGRGQRQAAADDGRRLARQPEQEIGRCRDRQHAGQHLQQAGAETERRITHNRCGDSSRPITNSISTTPNCEIVLTPVVSSTNPSNCGPITTPASR